MRRSLVARHALVLGTRRLSGARPPRGSRALGTSLKLRAEDASATRPPSASFVHHRLPLSTDERLREKFISPFGDMRVGVVMEYLDAMAGTSAFAHAGLDMRAPSLPCHIATAAVDHIHVTRTPSIDQDMILNACVVWTGRSSMDVRVEATQAGSSGGEEPLLVSTFTMVARKAEGGAQPVPAVAPEQPHEFGWHTEAQARRAAHEAARARTPRAGVTGEEGVHLKELWDEHVVPARRNPRAPRPWMYVEETGLESTQIMMPQQKNLHNRIFGGYVMRSALELAYANAFTFGQGVHPVFESVADIQFRAPVHIGDIVQFESDVVFAEGKHMQVRVAANVLKPATGVRDTTNVFMFSFLCPEDVPGGGVIPLGYEDTQWYIEGRRKHQSRAGKGAFAHFGGTTIVPETTIPLYDKFFL